MSGNNDKNEIRLASCKTCNHREYRKGMIHCKIANELSYRLNQCPKNFWKIKQ